MATQAEAAEHRAAVASITTLAIADLVKEWQTLPLDDPEQVRALLADLLAELLDGWHPAVSGIAADWYDDLRDAAGVPGRFSAGIVDLPPVQQIDATASWAASGIYTDVEKALADAATAVDRILANADRETIEEAADTDPARPRVARYASANACAFCALLATRGPVYRSEETASRKYHNLCRCIAVTVWTPTDYEEPAYVAEWRRLYLDAANVLGRGSGLKPVLSEMRRSGGLR